MHVIFRHADFFESAKHTFTHYTAKFTLFDVVTVRKVCSVKRNRNGFSALDGNVGDDLYCLVSDIDLRNAQTVGVGMFVDFDDFAYYDVGRLFFLIYDFFHFKTDCDEFFCKHFGFDIDIYVIFKPRNRN